MPPLQRPLQLWAGRLQVLLRPNLLQHPSQGSVVSSGPLYTAFRHPAPRPRLCPANTTPTPAHTAITPAHTYTPLHPTVTPLRPIYRIQQGRKVTGAVGPDGREPRGSHRWTLTFVGRGVMVVARLPLRCGSAMASGWHTMGL